MAAGRPARIAIAGSGVAVQRDGLAAGLSAASTLHEFDVDRERAASNLAPQRKS